MKRSLLVILSILCLILCLGLASCGGNGNPGTENGGTENGGTENGGTENGGTENGGTEDKEDYITITFDTKGGSTLDSIQLEKGSKIPKPQDPTRAGYTFVDWQYSGEKWSFIGYVATEDMTLEASWTIVTYTIEYVGAIGEKKTYTVEDEFDLVGQAEGINIFSGWYLDEDFTKPISKIERGTTGNLKLYGKTKDSGLKLELRGDEYAVVGCGKDVTSVTIPETCNGIKITTIGDYAFSYCEGLTSVTIGNGVTTIGNNAFSRCRGLTSVTIPNSVTTIGDHAFNSCTSLTSITIGSGAVTISESAFYWCYSLTSINVDNENPSYKTIDGNLYSKDGGTLVRYAPGKRDTDFVVPSNVTKIGEDAFYGCEYLTSVTIGNDVARIGSNAFYYCNKLTIYCEVESKPSFFSAGWNNSNCPVVWDCKNNEVADNGRIYLVDEGIRYSVYEGKATVEGQGVDIVTANIKEKISYKGNEYVVTAIGYYAFNSCTSLTRVTIPNSVTTIGDRAFNSCTSLTSITVDNGNLSYKSIDGNLYSKDGGTLIQYAIGKTKESFEIPNSVTTIGDYAFYYCTSLTSVTIPNSVTTIGNHAFYGCTSLTSVTIGNGVTTIGDYAFWDCTSLTRVDISDIGAWCNISFGEYYSNPLYYAKNLYLNGALVTDLVIPNGIATIGDRAFSGCTSITSVTIPNSVTTIGNNAFSNCAGLTSIEIPNSVTSIGNGAFSGCTSITSVEIPNSVTTIGNNAFNCMSLARVDISDIGAWCNISFGRSNSNPLEYAKNLYLNGVLVTDLVIPNGVTKIGSNAFFGCTSITSVTIGNGVTTIGNNAFVNCTGLTRVAIGNGVTTIYENAFYGCTSLTRVDISDISAWCNISFGFFNSNPLEYAKNLYLNGVLVTDLVIPNGVTTISEYAFSGCTSITSVTIPNSITTIGGNAFRGCTGLTIYCEAESKPSGWDTYWNPSNCPVVWGHKFQ